MPAKRYPTRHLPLPVKDQSDQTLALLRAVNQTETVELDRSAAVADRYLILLQVQYGLVLLVVNHQIE